jgi:hypothetical protein
VIGMASGSSSRMVPKASTDEGKSNEVIFILLWL